MLGRKLGPILFQLPPKWKVNVDRLETFLQALPPQHRYAFEFREPSWHTESVYETLQRYKAAFCIYDLAGFHSPILLTATFGYVRLHGPGCKYQGCYSAEALHRWAAQLAAWSEKLRDVYVYFDNDDSGYAPRNALELKELLAKDEQ